MRRAAIIAGLSITTFMGGVGLVSGQKWANSDQSLDFVSLDNLDSNYLPQTAYISGSFIGEDDPLSAVIYSEEHDYRDVADIYEPNNRVRISGDSNFEDSEFASYHVYLGGDVDVVDVAAVSLPVEAEVEVEANIETVLVEEDAIVAMVDVSDNHSFPIPPSLSDIRHNYDHDHDDSYIMETAEAEAEIADTHIAAISGAAAQPLLPANSPTIRLALISQSQADYISELTVGSGDTLTSILTSTGISNHDALAAATAAGEYYDLRRMSLGQEILVTFKDVEGSDNRLFTGLRIISSPEEEVAVVRNLDSDDFEARLIDRPAILRMAAAEGTITSNLMNAAQEQNIPSQVMIDMMQHFSGQVDFRRDLHVGDTFELVFEEYVDDLGEVVRNGDILYAALTLSGEHIPVYRFTTADGQIGYFTNDGQSMGTGLLSHPVENARISSGYGMRIHPVTGRRSMHKGIDFAAPQGTPIHATGDGIVEIANRRGSFGNYVRIRHSDEMETAYAHMQGFASGIIPGEHVSRGDVIGYLGTTGRSTGPHVHYEVLIDGEQVNPATVTGTPAITLSGADLENFHDVIRERERIYAGLSSDHAGQVALAE